MVPIKPDLTLQIYYSFSLVNVLIFQSIIFFIHIILTHVLGSYLMIIFAEAIDADTFLLLKKPS
jgi:hypothetical protein